ncbi:DUF6477 family protein [Microbaculum sp. FT89]|uniref:DUF6477 family protein n=1 Tax=Microbaculum sp. FT89 TaxID=3447298 RepID=UPI003F52B790
MADRIPRKARGIRQAVGAGLVRYERRRHLPWLARATPDEIASTNPAVAQSIVARLERALRAERRRGRAGHWSYDINRHIALMQALAAEKQRLGKVSLPRR